MEKTARDHIIVEGCGKVGTAGGIGHDREKGFECARCKRSVEFASNGALPRPTVDETGVLGAMPGCDIVERIIVDPATANDRSEEHTSELQSLMRISFAVFCLKNKN